jgi:hypothetical protein
MGNSRRSRDTMRTSATPMHPGVSESAWGRMLKTVEQSRSSVGHSMGWISWTEPNGTYSGPDGLQVLHRVLLDLEDIGASQHPKNDQLKISSNNFLIFKIL